jgi:hypothetical protein
MGNDFNILEYADPELDTVTGGEKTNILDENLDLEEEDSSKEEHKGVKKELPDKGRYEVCLLFLYVKCSCFCGMISFLYVLALCQ